MNCPQCGEDYSDSIRDKFSKRISIGPLEHYGNNFMISGKACPNCGFVAEFITKPTGNPFYKKDKTIDRIYTHSDFKKYLELRGLTGDFNEFIEKSNGCKRANK